MPFVSKYSTDPVSEPIPPPSSPPTPLDRVQSWAKWLAIINGALLGSTLGFVLVYALELALRQHGPSGTAVAASQSLAQEHAVSIASRASSVIVPLCFLGGVYVGSKLGPRLSRQGYKLMAGLTGVLGLAFVWAMLALTR
jgi:hypothetical protein